MKGNAKKAIKKKYTVNSHEAISLAWSLETALVDLTQVENQLTVTFDNKSHLKRWKDVHFLEFGRLPYFIAVAELG